jgi:hypothetical protein
MNTFELNYAIYVLQLSYPVLRTLDNILNDSWYYFTRIESELEKRGIMVVSGKTFQTDCIYNLDETLNLWHNGNNKVIRSIFWFEISTIIFNSDVSSFFPKIAIQCDTGYVYPIRSIRGYEPEHLTNIPAVCDLIMNSVGLNEIKSYSEKKNEDLFFRLPEKKIISGGYKVN